jgi:hypothetical protein
VRGQLHTPAALISFNRKFGGPQKEKISYSWYISNPYSPLIQPVAQSLYLLSYHTSELLRYDLKNCKSEVLAERNHRKTSVV